MGLIGTMVQGTLLFTGAFAWTVTVAGARFGYLILKRHADEIEDNKIAKGTL